MPRSSAGMFFVLTVLDNRIAGGSWYEYRESKKHSLGVREEVSNDT